MSQLVTETVGGEAYQYYALGEHIVRAIGVCGGRPTFKYTRIEVTGILERLAAGRTIEQLVNGYRGRLSHDGILEAIMLVSNHFSQTLPELSVAPTSGTKLHKLGKNSICVTFWECTP